MCLNCQNKGTKDFKSPQAVKQHMIDKGHCFMQANQLAEYIKFFDFSKGVEISM